MALRSGIIVPWCNSWPGLRSRVDRAVSRLAFVSRPAFLSQLVHVCTLIDASISFPAEVRQHEKIQRIQSHLLLVNYACETG
jgi:hypothetical protein